MKITFFGAAGEVTGSSSLVETGQYKILIDCGMFQGSDFNDAKNHNPLPFNPSELSHVFITHAHLDHTGRLPLLVKNGYTGHFYATAPTLELAELVMKDAHGIMLYNNKKFGKPILYDETDIAAVVAEGKRVEYGEAFVLGGATVIPTEVEESRNQRRRDPSVTLGMTNNEPPPSPRNMRGRGQGEVSDVTVTFHDVGHIFGSAFIEIQAEGKKVVFSGDVGNVHVPILKDTENLPTDLDLLVCESTYGDRLHEAAATREEMIEGAILESASRGGVLMIPSFALERTQELIYELNKLIDHKHKLTGIPIYLDSPLAIDAINVYRKYPKYYDAKASEFFKAGDDIFNFNTLVTTYSRAESMKINHTPGPKVIIAGAGMMNGGRILHHALRYLSDSKNTFLFIGYQSPGTLGHKIQTGQSPVNVLGERVEVNCKIKAIGALSAHGDQNKLASWIGAARPKQVILNHGDPAASKALAERLKREAGIAARLAQARLTIDV